MDNKFENITGIFDEPIRKLLSGEDLSDVEEIRLRSKRGIELLYTDRFSVIEYDVSPAEILSTIRRSMRYSLFANEDALINGMIIIPGGHRVSFSGRALKKGNVITSMDSFSGVCLRIAREVIGCAENIIPYISVPGGQVNSSLIISPPGVGKTTVLRDSIRILSSGKNAKKVVCVDERGEICSNVGGILGMDVGRRCDVLSYYDKHYGINIAVRSLSPEVIATDEIGSVEDSAALSEAVRSGVKILATAHAGNMDELRGREVMANIIKGGVFDRYIFISRKGRIILPHKVYDSAFREVRI